MTGYQWEGPRPVLFTPEEIAVWRAYDAEHSLPSAEVRARLLHVVKDLPQFPACEDAQPVDRDAEWPAEGWYVPDVACATCEDQGEIKLGEWGLLFPCPDCDGEWSWHAELFDDMERGK